MSQVLHLNNMASEPVPIKYLSYLEGWNLLNTVFHKRLCLIYINDINLVHKNK